MWKLVNLSARMCMESGLRHCMTTILHILHFNRIPDTGAVVHADTTQPLDPHIDWFWATSLYGFY